MARLKKRNSENGTTKEAEFKEVEPKAMAASEQSDTSDTSTASLHTRIRASEHH